jgi:hypothetical protein
MDEALQGQPLPDAPEAPEALDVPQTEVATPETEAQADPKPVDKAPKDPVQKRFDQITWQKHELERRLNAEVQARQEVERRAQELWQQQQEFIRQRTQPTLDQFNFDPAQYQKAVQEHNAQYLQQQRQVFEAQQARQQQAQARASYEQTVNTRIAEAGQKFADYDEVVTNNPALPDLTRVNPQLLQTILLHPEMPELTYYLGKNPTEAHRVANLQPQLALVELGKIVAKLPANTPKQPSKAPPPPSAVGSNASVTKKLEDITDDDEWFRVRAKQVAARRKR